MAFNEAGILSIGTGGSYNHDTDRRAKIFHYVTEDSLATVVASGYFNNFAGKLQKGDIILVSAVINGTLAVRMIGVAGIASGVVTTVADATA